MNPLDLDIITASKQIDDRDLSPVDLVEACLDRVDRVKETNAFITVNADEARAVARACTDLIAAGYRIGPLHGIPIALKDNVGVAGQLTTAGSAVLADHRPTYDATVVRKLRAAGAIIIGKTNMHEFAWGGTSANPHYGSVKSPWDLSRMPGGSSGGSGVAVATGAGMAAVGTDTGGSVRLPSSLNGITGLRPTIGRVSNYGVIPLAWTMDTVGPMARSAQDCAILLDAFAGHDPNDPGSSTAPTEHYSAAVRHPSVAGLRIGLIDDYSLTHVQPSVGAAVEQALRTLLEQGAVQTAVQVPDIEGNISAQLTIEAAEPSTYHQRTLREQPQNYGDDVRLLLQTGELLPAVHYLQAQRYRAMLRTQMLAALERVDVIVCPTLPFTATPLGETTVEIDAGVPEDMLAAIMQFTGLPSLTGLPAMSVPCGFDDAGLPIGLQLIGRPFAEASLLRVAAAFQNATDFHRRQPPFPAV
ncbi:amidase [Gordonia hydrophobica]|uniref:Amidase n=1 Tax=Gordonia hydrophobica TaxID=40516 RepID=A0ABZ2U720_9ACTN|nr:amidase [Gordonia hydrophobica]MBM7365370.1 aspartyl-tRNA(Asn)/glutamyl-tRNA(Gln) amidotransferase subunit A [Gordonia hydrophobica]